ncbi:MULTISPECIES: MFS transporter [unclassified Pseudomonas]|uniref:MFS transporter n=1 Tax=unclassified Pseudomonas TaxID=196821 RepID=UPI00087156F6|nr:MULTISPECIES: MFS transporter [unclassified Pseudomonas]SCW95520.1 Major Facilitator Superfamily protein [Pseudomonas sp. NFACC05-1]SDY13102.1 Major Facilitator Superfamily protein [Pseudomonas sp. NFACC08-1]
MLAFQLVRFKYYFSSLPFFIWMLFIGTFLTRATSMMVWPFISIVLYTRFGFSTSTIGLILTCSIALSSLVSFYSGYLSDKIGRLKIILVGCVVAMVSYLLLGISTHAEGYIAGTLLANLSWALVNNPIKTVIGDVIESCSLVERAMHLRYFFLNAGAAVGPYFGLKLGISTDSLSFVLVTASYLALLAGVMVFGRGITLKAINTTSLRSTLQILSRDHVFLLLVINNIVMMFIFGSFDSSVPQLMASLAFEGYLPFVANLIVLHATVIVLLQLPLARVLAQATLETKIHIGSVLLVLSQAGMTLAAHFYQVQLLWYGAVLLLSLSQALLFPCLNLFVDSLAPRNLRGAYFGAASLYSIGFSMAPIVGGFFIQALSGTALFVFLTVTSLVMAFTFAAIFTRLHHRNLTNDKQGTRSTGQELPIGQ